MMPSIGTGMEGPWETWDGRCSQHAREPKKGQYVRDGKADTEHGGLGGSSGVGVFAGGANCEATTFKWNGNGASFHPRRKKKRQGEGNRWRGKEKHICHLIQGAEVFWEQICHLSIKHEAAWLCFHCAVAPTMITSPTTAPLWARRIERDSHSAC